MQRGFRQWNAESPGSDWTSHKSWRRTLALFLMTASFWAATLLSSLAANDSATNAVPATDETTTSLKQLSLEDLAHVDTVVGASKHEQPISDAPASVSIVTRDTIQKFGYRTLADILRGVGGFYITSDRSYSYIGVRGMNRPGDYGGRVLLTINGHRINEPIFDSSFNGQDFPLDVDLIDRVEVIRGPGSTLYGNNAFLAVINVITRHGRDVDGFEASGSAGSFDTFTGRFTYGKETKSGIEILLSGSIFESAGHDMLRYKEFETVNNGVSEDLDYERAIKFFGDISWGDFTLEGAFGDRFKDVPTGAYGTAFGVSPNNVTDIRSFITLKYHHECERGWIFDGRLYADDYYYRGFGPYGDPSDPSSIVFNKDLGKATDWGGEFQLSKTFFEKHRLTAGAEFRQTVLIRQQNYDINPYFLYADTRSDADFYSYFLQDEYSVCSNFLINAGVRYDYYSAFGDTINPRVALIYHPVPETTLKFLYGQAYRSPNAYETAYVAPGYSSNYSLRPETIRSYELVWEQEFCRHYRFTGSLFYNDMKDLITQQIDGGGNLIFQNTDSVTVRGAEAELDGNWESGWNARLSYTYADGRQEASTTIPSWLPNSPRHLAQASVSAPLWKDKIFASVEVLGMSRRATLADNRVPGFFIVNATLFSRELVRNLEASASIYNLFDRHYRDPVGPDFTQDSIRQDGRTFRAKLTYRF